MNETQFGGKGRSAGWCPYCFAYYHVPELKGIYWEFRGKNFSLYSFKGRLRSQKV